MQVRSFIAPSMPEALDQVRSALGSDAVLLRTRMISDDSGRKVEITAALDNTSTLDGDDGEDIDRQAWGEVTGELESAWERIDILEHGDTITRWLHEADFLPSVMAQLARAGSGHVQTQEDIEKEILAGVRVGEGLLPLPDETRRIALIGPSGVGKTTALVKLAAQAASVSRTDVLLVNLDSYRPGAEEYLAQVGDTLRIPVLAERSREVQDGMPEAEALMLIDTDSRIHGSDPGSVAVRSTLLRLKPDVTALVLSATWRSADLYDTLQRYKVCHPTHLIFTGIDLTIRYGGILSIAMESNLPVACMVTTGRFDSGTRLFRPEALLQQMRSLGAAPVSRKDGLRV